MDGQFGALAGDLHPSMARPVGKSGRVEVSAIRAGCADSPARATTSIKFVAAGCEIYRYAGRTHRVSAGMFLLLPEGHAGEAATDRGAGVTLGMCVFLPGEGVAPSPLAEPLIFSADASTLGRLLADAHRALFRAPRDAPALAERLLACISARLEPLVVDTVRVLDGLSAAKPSTRYETLRRLNLARAYLHAIDDRPVELAELAREAGVSRFQLARNFGDCFGLPPAAYHRRLRLERAREQIRHRRLTCSQAALRYGFSDAAHFSHAFASAFGHPPSAALG